MNFHLASCERFQQPSCKAWSEVMPEYRGTWFAYIWNFYDILYLCNAYVILCYLCNGWAAAQGWIRSWHSCRVIPFDSVSNRFYYGKCAFQHGQQETLHWCDLIGTSKEKGKKCDRKTAVCTSHGVAMDTFLNPIGSIGEFNVRALRVCQAYLKLDSL